MSGGIFLFGREECAQLNQEYRQLLDENLTHVEKLKSTDGGEKVLDNSNHVRNTQKIYILYPLTLKHLR